MSIRYNIYSFFDWPFDDGTQVQCGGISATSRVLGGLAANWPFMYIPRWTRNIKPGWINNRRLILKIMGSYVALVTAF